MWYDRSIMSAGGIGSRKGDHIDLAATGDVGFHTTGTLLDCVKLVHQALPELSTDQIDTSLELFGKRLSAPLVIASMTGGVERAGNINRELASIAESRGYAFGLGSQRAMHVKPGTRDTYMVREAAPTALVLGNLGLVQARQMSTAEVRALVQEVGADALFIHLNPAMEIVQPGGDRDFSGGISTLKRLASELGFPIIVKETGCGLSVRVADTLKRIGIRHVDVSGAGGTSWVAVEMHRAEGHQRALGEAFREWGIPTAASVVWMAEAGLETVIATGGISTGIDVAKSIALGATAAGVARPVLQALVSGGREAAEALLDQIEAELRAAMLLVGAGSLTALRAAPRIIVGDLRTWIAEGALRP
jgi:isopentenyl-diphosphate delta-isomerase